MFCFVQDVRLRKISAVLLEYTAVGDALELQAESVLGKAAVLITAECLENGRGLCWLLFLL